MPTGLGVGKVEHSADVTARLLPAGQGDGFTIALPGDVGPAAAAFPSGEGRYALTVETSGSWLVTVEFPSNSSGGGSGSSFNGTGGEVRDPQSGGTLIVPGPGTYLLQVYSDAAWAISIN